MKRVLLVLLLFFVSKGFSQDLFEAASDQYDVLINEFRMSQPNARNDFWDCPLAKSVNPNESVGGDDGWGGAQMALSAILNYENTRNLKYYELFDPLTVNSWSHWLINNSPWALYWGTTWEGDLLSNGDTISDEIVGWSDDAGWLINIYTLIAQYTGDEQFNDSAYKMLLDTDTKYGRNIGADRCIRYLHITDPNNTDHRYNMARNYILCNILGALELYNIYNGRNIIRADSCLTLATTYFKFVNKYLINSGEVLDNYEWFPGGGFTVSGSSSSKFTAIQMMLPVIYQLFDQIEKNGIIIDATIDFYKRAIDASNYVINNCTEPSNSGSGLVFLNLGDPNVNGFSFYWWQKYIIPLNPDLYGDVVVNTANAIIANNNTSSDILGTCWNGPNTRRGGTGSDCDLCVSSNSIYYPTPTTALRWEVEWHTAAVTIAAAASAVEPMKKSYKQVLIPAATNIPALYMSATEITNAEYARIMNDNPYDYKFGILPISGITYYDAILYCNARSIREGLDTVYTYDILSGNLSPKMQYEFCVDLVNLKANNYKNGYRLPTRKEWEYAYLGGVKSTDNNGYYWPNGTNAVDYAHYGKSLKQPVGTLLPNGFGLYDMAGNVSEWVTEYSNDNSVLFTRINGSYGDDIANLQYNDDVWSSGLFIGNNHNGFRVVRKAPDITPAINLLLD